MIFFSVQEGFQTEAILLIWGANLKFSNELILDILELQMKSKKKGKLLGLYISNFKTNT